MPSFSEGIFVLLSLFKLKNKTMIVLYVILVFVGLFLITAAIMPSKYSVQKEITINKPSSDVFEKVADLKHYRDWNPWHRLEPTALSEITGNAATVGHKFSWEGKKIGQGSLTIKGLTPPQEIILDLEFIKPWKSQALDSWTFTDLKNGSTKVVWNNNGPLPYPMGRLMGSMIIKNLNQQFEQGLNNLKELCEK